jgi:hypothetical protein
VDSIPLSQQARIHLAAKEGKALSAFPSFRKHITPVGSRVLHVAHTLDTRSLDAKTMEITTGFWYLKDLPLYQETKPYIINLPLSYVPAGKRTNQVSSFYQKIRVKDIRASQQVHTLDGNGFELTTSIPIGLEYEEFDDAAKVKDIYCENLKAALLDRTGAEFGRVIHQAVCTWLIPAMLDESLRHITPSYSSADLPVITRFVGDTTAFRKWHGAVKMLLRISQSKGYTLVC